MEDNIIYFKQPTVLHDKIVLYGAGKFGEERLILDRDQAMLALIALTKFLYNDKNIKPVEEKMYSREEVSRIVSTFGKKICLEFNLEFKSSLDFTLNWIQENLK